MPANQPQQGGLQTERKELRNGLYMRPSSDPFTKEWVVCAENGDVLGVGYSRKDVDEVAAHLAPVEPTVPLWEVPTLEKCVQCSSKNLRWCPSKEQGVSRWHCGSCSATGLWGGEVTAPSPKPTHSGTGELLRKFSLGESVTKTKGSKWTGKVVGFYSTTLTPVGYAVESDTEVGSVQIYPETALFAVPQGPAPTGEEDYAGKLSHLLMYLTDGRLSKPDYDTAMLEAMIDDHVNELVDEEMKRRVAQPPVDKPERSAEVSPVIIADFSVRATRLIADKLKAEGIEVGHDLGIILMPLFASQILIRCFNGL